MKFDSDERQKMFKGIASVESMLTRTLKASQDVQKDIFDGADTEEAKLMMFMVLVSTCITLLSRTADEVLKIIEPKLKEARGNAGSEGVGSQTSDDSKGDSGVEQGSK